MGIRETTKAKREAMFDQFAREGLSYAEAGARAGMQAGYAGTFLGPAYDRIGKPRPGPGAKKKDPKEAVLDDSYKLIRSRLADMLYNYKRDSKLHPADIAIKTGVPQRLQGKATTAPFNYDWKLSEIVKLAEARGDDPIEFIRWLVR